MFEKLILYWQNYKIPAKQSFFWLKLAFLLGILALLIRQISGLNLNKESLIDILDTLNRNIWYFLGAIVLIIPNYFLETLKWQILTNEVESRTFQESIKDILKGLAAGLFTPFMLGDFLGRTVGFRKRNRTYVAALNLFNSVCQTYSSLLFGTLGIVLWYIISEPGLKNILLFPFVIFVTVSFLGIFFVFKFKISWDFLKRFKLFQPYLKKELIELDLPNRLRINVLLLSILRSIIFNLQFLFFYKAFGIVLQSSIYFIGINLILLIKTIGGGLNVFGDLTLREFVSLNFFGNYNVDEGLILIATFTVWFFNIFIPVICGIFYKPKL